MAGAVFGSWGLTLAAPRIVNDVSYVMKINQEVCVSWQGQYLVSLKGVEG